ncbi:MAG TPA: LLM class flavin-dependent oxidoreductase [Trebonia sp.]|nr:LLM class flavin-dependent oxidoreductase [Trebonia sp.]
MNIGIALTDAVAGSSGNTVDETVELVRQAAEAGLRSAWLGQRMDFDSVALAGIAAREVPGIALGTAAVPLTALAGASRTADLVTLGDEQTIAETVRSYFDAGATEVIFTQTNLLGTEARLRTWQLLGELARS